MRPRQSLAFRLVATGICFLVVALLSIALTLWATWQLKGGAAAVNEAGRVRMMTYRLALDAAADNRSALWAQLRAMDTTLDLLGTGDPSRPLFVPWSDASRAEFAAVRDQWRTLRERWSSEADRAPAADAEALVQRIDRFVTLIEQQMSRWTELLRGFQLAMVGLAIASAVLLLYATHLMVLEPLRHLGQGMAAVRGGDFGASVGVSSSDEFGELAAGFNSMADRLRSLYGDLEAKVRQKTALRIQRERLAALYEVSAFVAQAENLDALARGFVAKIRRISGADGVALRWSDERNRHYLMLAQEGLSAALTSDEQCLPSGRCECGQNVATAATRVIAIRSPERDALPCARAGFDTLLTVPVSLHHRVLGEIDLFYRQQRELDAEERSLVETLASHLAGGIESLRATAADRAAAIANERALLAQELHDSIAQSLAFLKIQVELLRKALQRDDDGATERTLAEIDAGVRESYADVRELLLHFRTRTNGQDIEPALRSTLQKFEQQTGLATDLQIDGNGVALPSDVQVQVLHVVQEALSNVRKHAHASTVHLRVQQAPEWRFEVVDDGCGFDADATSDDSHVGLHIMRERAQGVGALVTVRSEPGQGTRVAISVPRETSAIEVRA
jgi:two-component system nitrate/nitrite sensor histidine kinase NarX